MCILGHNVKILHIINKESLLWVLRNNYAEPWGRIQGKKMERGHRVGKAIGRSDFKSFIQEKSRPYWVEEQSVRFVLVNISRKVMLLKKSKRCDAFEVKIDMIKQIFFNAA